MRDNFQKIKLLRLYEMLYKDSSEDQPLRTSEICARLQAMNISCDRRTLARDIQLLKDFDYDVDDKYVGHEKGYFVRDRKFNDVELQILIDAVEAANFITKSKTAEMTQKIAAQGGSNRKKLMSHMETRFGVYKHSNESFMYSISELRQAIHAGVKVSFSYFDLGVKKDHKGNRERILRKEYEVVDGVRVYNDNDRVYIVEPLALVFNEDNYYLVAYNRDADKKSETIAYRIDRMLNVTMLEEEKIGEDAAEFRASQPKYKTAMFKMYHGDEYKVTLHFEKKLLGAVYDRAGEGISVREWDADHYRIDLDTSVAGTFFGWVFQFHTAMKIAAPQEVVDRYKQYVKDVLALYDTPESDE